VQRFLVLVEGHSPDYDDDVLLEVKEARSSSVDYVRGAERDSAGAASRVVSATKIMQVNFDKYLGVISVEGGERSYVVRSSSPYKAAYNDTDFDDKKLEESLYSDDFLEASGNVYALAHSRSKVDSTSFPESYKCCVKSWRSFRKTIAALAVKYAATVQGDLEIFKKKYGEPKKEDKPKKKDEEKKKQKTEEKTEL
jgi:uncharacterized protein (DUF2252 family)